MGMSPSALTVTYAANGNMTTGLDGKVMAYDGENRPVSVSFAGRTTTYVYGADRARLKKVETDPLTGQSTVTLPICSSGGICVSRFRNTGASPMRLPVISTARTSRVSASIPMWNFRHCLRRLAPCLRTCHSPSPENLMPVPPPTDAAAPVNPGKGC